MTDTVRFIHTADLHLDSPLSSLAARNPELGELLQDASRKLLQRLIDTALEEKVDALLIAGDLFDGDQRDVHTAMVLQRELRRLEAHDIPVFIMENPSLSCRATRWVDTSMNQASAPSVWSH